MMTGIWINAYLYYCEYLATIQSDNDYVSSVKTAKSI